MLSSSAGTQTEFDLIWVIREVPVTLVEIFPARLLLPEVKNTIPSCTHEILAQEAAAALGVIFQLFKPS